MIPLHTNFGRFAHRLCRGALLAALAFGALAPIQSCNVVGGGLYLISGPEKVAQLYDLDTARPTVIFIDDRLPVIKPRSNLTIVGRTAEELLLNDGKMEHMISAQDMAAVVSRDRSGTPMPIVQAGELVGADVVVYVWMKKFQLSEDKQSYTPQAEAWVKVVDVKEKKRLWPNPDGVDEWYHLTVSSPTKQGPPPTARGVQDAAYQDLAKRFGTAIGHIFVKHPIRDSAGGVGQ